MILLLNMSMFTCFRCKVLKLLLLILIQTNGRIIFKGMIKELILSKFVQFYLYSILNQRDKLIREKMSTKYCICKEKVFRGYNDVIFQLSWNQRIDLIGRIV